MKKLTTYQFIERAYKIHGDKYDYSKVEYVNNRTKVCIICPEHGEFMTLPSLFLLGHQCPKCSKYCVKSKEPAFVILSVCLNFEISGQTLSSTNFLI